MFNEILTIISSLLRKSTHTSRVLISVFLALFFMVLSNTSTADKINWYVLDYKPYTYTENGVFKGYGVQWMKLLQKELPQYEHNFKKANYSRFFRALEKGGNICSLGFYKSKKRDEVVHYSIPDVLWFPLQLFMRMDTYNQLGQPKSISIESILKNKLGRIGITKDKYYTSKIDKLFEEYKNTSQIVVNYTGKVVQNLFFMLSKDRIDFILEYPPEGNLTILEIDSNDSVVSVPILETAELNYSHTICSKTPWGKKAILNINKALIKLRKTPQWRKVYEDVIDKKLVEMYRDEYKRILLPVIN